MKLSNIVLFTFVLFALVVSAADFFYTYKVTNTLMLDELSYHLQSVSQSRASNFHTFLYSRFENAKAIASSSHIISLASAQKNSSNYSSLLKAADILLKEKLSSYTSIHKISVLAGDGSTILASDTSGMDADTVKALASLSEQSMIVGDIHWSKDYGTPCLDIGYPVRDRFGKIVGAVIIDVSLEELYSVSTDATGLLSKGETYFVNKDRLMVTPSRFADGTFLSMKVENVNVERCFAESSGLGDYQDRQIRSYRNYLGQEVFGTYSFVPETGWCLIAEVDKDELLGQVYDELMKSYLYAFVIILFFILIFSVMLANLVSTPLQVITNKIDRISKGQIDITLGRSNIFEYQNLVESLNRILASLKIAVMKVGVKKEELGLGEAVQAKKRAEEAAAKRAEQLERFAKLATGREERMIELKKRVVELERELAKKKGR